VLIDVTGVTSLPGIVFVEKAHPMDQAHLAACFAFWLIPARCVANNARLLQT
jgi:hypothetical protein